jgi:protein-disulfide isomerase
MRTSPGRLARIVAGALAVAAPTIAAQPATPREDCAPDAARDLLATGADVRITRQEVEARIEGSLWELRAALRRGREEQVELLVNSILLEREAEKHGKTTIALLEQEVISKVRPPTEAEVRAFYEQNRDRLPGGFGANRTAILRHLGRERENEEAGRLARRLRARADVRILTEGIDLSSTTLAPTTPVASVDGATLTLASVDAQLLPLLAYLEEETYALRRSALDAILEEILFAKEARARGLSLEALLEAEVVPSIRPVGDEDVLAFYEENKDRMDADVADPEGRLRILDHLQRREAERARAAFVDRLRREGGIEIFLLPPTAAAERLAPPDQPSLGPEDAPVTLVAFVDFECEKCSEVHEILREAASAFGASLRIVLRDFPLSAHEHAYAAALAAEAAREQGKYWEYVAVLFRGAPALGSEKLREYAREVGLDARRFEDALSSRKHADKVALDRRDGLSLGVISTPTVFVGGRRLPDESRAAIREAIEEALRARAAAR